MRPRRAAVRRAASAKAVARVQNRLLSRQAAVQSRLTRTLRQEQVEYGYSYTALFNGFSVRTARKNLEAIRNTKGVTCAFVAGSYALPTTQQADTQALQVALASSRFTGKGMTIAVLDTGLDTAHPAFANAPADAKFTKDYISGVLQAADLNAEVLMPGVTADDVYLSAKIPFAFDYAGKDAQVAPGSKWDAENLEHGTHVAGISAGYAVDGEGATFSGVAPDAQVIPMKVFDDSGTGAATTTILAALEDAYRLGVDAVNLSLGSYGGFTVDEDALINDVYNKLDDAGIMVITAAGNETSSSYMNSYGTDAPLTGDPDNSVVAVTAEYQGMTASFTVHVGPYPGSVELYHGWIQARSNRIFLQGKQGIVGAGRDGIHATDTAATSDDQIITFTNSDPNVVDLTNPVIRATSNRDMADECAFVDARNPGNAVITATATSTTQDTVQCFVTVVPKWYDGIQATQDTIHLKLGRGADLTQYLTLLDESGVVIPELNPVNYASLDESILSVDASGHVTALHTGTGMVRALLNTGDYALIAVEVTCDHDHTTRTETPATCTEDGSVTVICDDCDEVLSTETLPATGHSTVVKNAKDATCGDDGYTGDVVCAGCGEVQSKGEVIKATGEHHYDKGVCTVCGAKDPNYKPPTTGDSGVLLYVGLAVMAIGGSAVVVTRKKERT